MKIDTERIKDLLEKAHPCNMCEDRECCMSSDKCLASLCAWWLQEGFNKILNEIRIKDDKIHDLEEKVKQLELALERKEREIMILEDENEKSAKGLMKLMNVIDKTCKELAYAYNTCPRDVYDYKCDCDNCDKNYAKCWKRWAMNE